MSAYVDGAIAYLRANPVVAGGIGVVLLYLLIRKTKLFLFLLVLALVLGTVLFMIAGITGDETTREIIDQTVRTPRKMNLP